MGSLYVDREMPCLFGATKRVQVKTHPGGTDARIYVDGSLSLYEFGPDGWIYSLETGRFVSNLIIEEFARNYLWEGAENLSAKALFFVFYKIFCYTYFVNDF